MVARPVRSREWYEAGSVVADDGEEGHVAFAERRRSCAGIDATAVWEYSSRPEQSPPPGSEGGLPRVASS